MCICVPITRLILKRFYFHLPDLHAIHLFSNAFFYLSDQKQDLPLFSICWNKGHMHGAWLKMLSAEGLHLLWVLLDFYLQSTHRILFIALKNRGEVEL